MEDFECYEYVVKPKKDLKNKLLRAALIALYVAFVIAWLVFGFLTGLIPLLALIPVTTWILIFFTWRYVNVEYEYLIEGGAVTFNKVYDNRSRRTVTVFKIRSAELIAPMSDHTTKRQLEDYDPAHEYSFVSSPDAADAYTALYVNDDMEKCAVHFIASPKLQKSCRFYNANASRIRKSI